MPPRGFRLALCLGFFLLAAVPVHAQEAASAPTPELPMWERTLYKTLTYQTVSNLSDLALYGLVLGGTAAAGAGFLAANVASALALYYSHEYAWESLGPPPDEKTHRTIAEKAGAYRVLASAKNFALGYAFGGSVGVATGFAVAGSIADTAIFVANEYAWDLFRPRTAAP